MTLYQKLSHYMAILSVSALISTLAFAQSKNPEWIEDLEFQLDVQQQCKVVEYEVMNEGKLGGRNIYNATVICEDGRKFDAHKMDSDGEFTINICAIVKC